MALEWAHSSSLCTLWGPDGNACGRSGGPPLLTPAGRLSGCGNIGVWANHPGHPSQRAPVGGASGLTQIPQILSPFQTLAVVGLGVCLSLGCLWRFYQTGLGLAVVCAREDEIVAHCFGISSFRARLAAFALGNGFAGLAGALAAQLFVFVSPKAASFEKSVEILLGLILGGIHNLWGGVCGAICLVALPEILRFLPGLLSHVGTADLSPLSQLLTHLSQNTMLLFAVGVVLHLRFGQQLGSRLGRKRKPI